MAQTQIIFEGKDAALLESYRRQLREQEKVISGYEKMAEGGKRAGDKAAEAGNLGADAFLKFAGQVVGVTSAMGAAMLAIDAIKAEYENLKAIQETALTAQLSAGERKIELLKNFSPDATMTADQLTDMLNAMSRETKATRAVVDTAFTMGLAARGDLTNRDVEAATRLSVAANPTNAQAAGEVAQRLLQIQGIAGGDALTAQGYIEGGNALMPVFDAALYGANVVPAQINAMLAGWSPEQVAEMSGIIGTASADTRGAKAGTALIQLQQNMMGFRPTTEGRDADGAFQIPQEQIDAWTAALATNDPFQMKDVIRDNPELQRLAMASMQFPVETGNVQRSFLRGEFDDLTDAIRERMPEFGPKLQGFALDQVQARANDPEVQALMRDQDRLVAVEQFELAGDSDALNAEARRILGELYKKTGSSTTDFWRARDIDFRRAIGQSLPEAILNTYGAALRQDDARIAEGRDPSLSGNFTEAERKIVRELVPSLDNLTRTLDRINETPLPAQQQGRAD